MIRDRGIFIGLTGLLLIVFLLSLALGPVSLAFEHVLKSLGYLLGIYAEADAAQQQANLIIGQIRLPRTLLGLAVGAVLALSGVAMQGLFRNPLADPGLIGVSSGAALGAAVAIVGPLVWLIFHCFGSLWLSFCFHWWIGDHRDGVSVGEA
ncbi:iron chelate uptake ABC transporter family permease subunit [Thiopseudomonas alkaliphila]|uniref:iron chelate uptake ABC transporter family permease subunit n=1 Tax=Thiopseudomonas alkaliphila TaxID=1697053 RepID=UPI0039DF3880